jgi:hypothetical protein
MRDGKQEKEESALGGGKAIPELAVAFKVHAATTFPTTPTVDLGHSIFILSIDLSGRW